MNNPFTEQDITLQYEEHIEQFTLLFKCSNKDFLLSIQDSYLFQLLWILCKKSVKQNNQKSETSEQQNSIMFLVHQKARSEWMKKHEKEK